MSTESTRFGKYRLLQRIGAGGMGEVHLAKLKGPSGFEKLVVIKRLLQNRREEQRFIDMFFSEARVTAQLSHSNIVQIYEVDNFEGVPYIAMEYVRGKSLRNILDAVRRRGGPKNTPHRKLPCLPAHYIVQIFTELCQGLAFAHDARHMSGATLGLIHRDINPHNVLLTYRGEVKLIDFGIAKSELTLDKTQAGTIKGTVIYMSPEQSAGKKLDRRSDMFAVGICLYEILSGTNPFQKDNMAASLESIRQAKVPPLDMDNPEIAPFAPIVYRALAKNPDERYGDCEAMGQALNKLLQDGVVPRLEVSLGDFLQRLFVDAIEEEDRLLSQTEIVEAADLAAYVANRQPQPMEEDKTVALGASPRKIESDQHTVADTPYGEPISDELSGIGAPVQLPTSNEVDPRATRSLSPSQSSVKMARPNVATLDVPADEAQTLGHFDLGSLGGASAPRVRANAKARFKDAYNEAEPDAGRGLAAGGAPPDGSERDTAGDSPRTGPWDVSVRRLQFLTAPKAFWQRLPPSERFTTSVLASVVALAWLCVGLAYISSDPLPEKPQDAPRIAEAQQSADASAHAGKPGEPLAKAEADTHNEHQPASPPTAAAPGAHTGEPLAYNEELHIDAMADVNPSAAAETPPAQSTDTIARRNPVRRPFVPRRRPPPKAPVESGGQSLLVGMDPAVPMLKDGVAQPRNIKTHNQPGTLQFEPVAQGPNQSSFGIKVHYRMTPKGMLYTIESDPWANVYGAGGLSLGRTPIRDMLGSTTTVLEFRNPHVTSNQRISLHVSSD